jgi:iron complex outermembrane receptor protein
VEIQLFRTAAFGVASLAVMATPSLSRAAEAMTAAPALDTVIVTVRQRREDAQKVPVSVSVIGSQALERTVTYNVNQLTALVPSLNYSSPNPRNTAFTVRGLGSSVVAVSQSNDGLEPGVGFYVDQVYHGRPATAAFDLLDVERVEVLHGPQGTLFGKNTTAGAINIVSKIPSFTPEAQGELTAGNIGYFQGKAAVSGPIVGDKLAVRLSGAVTRRDGVIDNVVTHVEDNNVHTDSLRGQLLFKPAADFNLRLTADYSNFHSTCCTQVYVGVGATLKAVARQYPALAAGLNYAPPSLNPYDRKTDIDAALLVDTNEGGVSSIADWNLGKATITSVSAWRWWNWDAANDRDYTGVQVQTVQHIPSRQDQYSQELRIASNDSPTVSYVAGVYWFAQKIVGRPITAYGSQAAYWLIAPPPATPSNLLDGYTTDGATRYFSNSYAAFGEATWRATDKLSLTGGLRYTTETKHGKYVSTVFGGLATTTTALINSKLSILRPQAYHARVSDGSLAGRANASYQFADDVMGYVSFAKGEKSGGINMSGLPLDAANDPAIATAIVRPEKNTTEEIGLKTRLLQRRLTLNIDAFNTEVRDFQTNVVDTGPGALRGYLANIPKVKVKGVELDSAFVVGVNLTGHLSVTYADGRYADYRAGPCPLELIGSATTACDLTGRPLSALPHWVWSTGGEYRHGAALGGMTGEAYVQGELTNRSHVYGDPSDSKYTVIAGYTVVNASIGFRASRLWEVSVWAKNLFAADYIQNLTIQAGNSGLIVGTPSDPRQVGVTLRARY